MALGNDGGLPDLTIPQGNHDLLCYFDVRDDDRLKTTPEGCFDRFGIAGIDLEIASERLPDVLRVKLGVVETFQHSLSPFFKTFSVRDELIEHFETRSLFGTQLV